MSVVWATRGRSWGFRFLLDGGEPDPLPAYERAFLGTEGDPTTYRRSDDRVAVRFSDPEGRRDRSGRPIPHELVVDGPLTASIRSSADAERIVWPLLADAYADVWDDARPPSGSMPGLEELVRAHEHGAG